MYVYLKMLMMAGEFDDNCLSLHMVTKLRSILVQHKSK